MEAGSAPEATGTCWTEMGDTSGPDSISVRLVEESDLSILVFRGIHAFSAVTPKFLGFSGLVGHQEAAASQRQGTSLGGVEVQGRSRCYAASPHTQGGTMPYIVTAPRSRLNGQGTPPQATPVHMLDGWAATGRRGCSAAWVQWSSSQPPQQVPGAECQPHSPDVWKHAARCCNPLLWQL